MLVLISVLIAPSLSISLRMTGLRLVVKQKSANVLITGESFVSYRNKKNFTDYLV